MTDRGYMLPSQRDDWGTPQKLFDELNKEFHFNLDAAASDSNHKCDKYFTVEDNGLMQNWGGIQCLSILPMAEAYTIGAKRLMQKKTDQRLLLPFCQPEPILDGFTSLSTTKQKFALSKGGYISMTARMPLHFHL